MLFDVSALGSSGRVRLRLEAQDAGEASQLARQDGLTVLTVRPASRGRLTLPARRRRFPLTLFSGELLALLGSGLSLLESLQTLAEKEAHPDNRRLLADVIRHLQDGQPLSVALGHFPQVFPELYIATVRASERTGELPQALGRFIAYQNQLELVRKKAIAASIYPVLLLIVGLLVTLFLLGFVTPRFAAIYADNMERLPWGSRLLMSWGSFVSGHAYQALALAGSLAAGLAWAARRPATRAFLSRQAWRIPTLGERLRIFQLTRFYRTVGMLLSGGIPVVTALDMASHLLNPDLRARAARAGQAIREGKPISAAMEASGLTTPVASRMLRVGERSGRMDQMMEAIAAFHDEETNRFVDWFTRLFEPILMAVIGLIIGLIVVMLYMPIFELAGSLE